MERLCSYGRMFLTSAGRSERRFDSIHGVQTTGRLALYELGTDSPNLVYSVEYRPTPVREFLDIVVKLGIDYSQWIFIDLGAGKGRALLLACRFPFKQVIGVEFSPELASVAQANVSANHDPARKCHQVSVICSDASTYDMPLEPSVVYLNNPFHGPVMERVVDNLQISLREHPRDLCVVYWNPACEEILDRAPFLTKTHHDKQYSVYRSLPNRSPVDGVHRQGRGRQIAANTRSS